MHFGGALPAVDKSRLTEKERRSLWWRTIIINSIFVAAWFTFSALLLIYNKAIVDEKHLHFPYPLFGTAFQMPIQFALACAFRYGFPQKFKPANNPSPRDYLTKVLPTAVATGLDIGLGNLALKLITLSLYTMVKSSALIFVLGFAFMLKLETFSWRLVGVIVLIAFGVFLMTFNTTSSYAWAGIALVLTSSFLAGFRWSFTQLLLRRHDVGLDNPAATIFWLSPAMGLTVTLISLPVDNWAAVFSSEFFATPAAAAKSCLMLGLPGVLAFCMVMSEFELLRRTSIVTTSIVGIFKEVATITLSAWIFGDVLTPLKVTGAGVTICGIALYSWHKYSKTVLAGTGSPPNAEDGYDLVQDDEEVFALGESDDELDSLVSRDRHGRRATGTDAGDDRTDVEDSLLEADGLSDARSLRSVQTVGSVARQWRNP
ncbi:TPT-domain-containing protein [Auriculariales sp. MPI-PUGE-AT-0066]|nr:TPT-domain-containing protein [Auriculariales sp. MPI-PUGE-AT-0066]